MVDKKENKSENFLKECGKYYTMEKKVECFFNTLYTIYYISLGYFLYFIIETMLKVEEFKTKNWIILVGLIIIFLLFTIPIYFFTNKYSYKKNKLFFILCPMGLFLILLLLNFIKNEIMGCYFYIFFVFFLILYYILIFYWKNFIRWVKLIFPIILILLIIYVSIKLKDVFI